MIVQHDIAGPVLTGLRGGKVRLALWERGRVTPERRPVLYIHGATFRIGLAFTFSFDGLSWADHLAENGFWPWGLDFAGFGASKIDWEAIETPRQPFGRAPDAAEQIDCACGHIVERTGASTIDLIAHSWGTIPARLFAARRPERVGRLVLFGPIVGREGAAQPSLESAWREITIEDQHGRFVKDVPADHQPVLLDRHFHRWAESYLDSDAESRTRSPVSVRVPAGPAADVRDAWCGTLADAAHGIRAAVAVIRGEWDSLCTDRDAANLISNLAAAPETRDIKLPAATHLMHLEEGRMALWDAAAQFLRQDRGCSSARDRD